MASRIKSATEELRTAVGAEEKPKPEATSKIETKKGTIVTIPGVKIHTLQTLLIGTAPLIVHNFDRKIINAILGKHMGEASAGREKKDPIANFEASRYKLADGTDGIPAGGLKACFVDGFHKSSGVPMTQAKGSIRVIADDEMSSPPLVRLLHPLEPEHIISQLHSIGETHRIPNCRQDVVRNDSGVVDIRHRACYWPWALHLRIEYLPYVMSERQLLQAIANSGFKVGQCEWRPGSKESKSGSFGTFRLATPEEIDAFSDDKLFGAFEWPKPRLKKVG